LKDRAEQAAKNTSHDLPLTVNDEVLSFLNFSRHRAERPSSRPLTAFWPLPGHDFARPAGRRCSAGFDLPAQAEARFSRWRFRGLAHVHLQFVPGAEMSMD